MKVFRNSIHKIKLSIKVARKPNSNQNNGNVKINQQYICQELEQNETAG